MTILKVTLKNVYGREMIYPSCETARKFADLLGVKTFNDHQVKSIKTLGYTFEVVAEKVSI